MSQPRKTELQFYNLADYLLDEEFIPKDWKDEFKKGSEANKYAYLEWIIQNQNKIIEVPDQKEPSIKRQVYLADMPLGLLTDAQRKELTDKMTETDNERMTALGGAAAKKMKQASDAGKEVKRQRYRFQAKTTTSASAAYSFMTVEALRAQGIAPTEDREKLFAQFTQRQALQKRTREEAEHKKEADQKALEMRAKFDADASRKLEEQRAEAARIDREQKQRDKQIKEKSTGSFADSISVAERRKERPDGIQYTEDNRNPNDMKAYLYIDVWLLKEMGLIDPDVTRFTSASREWNATQKIAAELTLMGKKERNPTWLLANGRDSSSDDPSMQRTLNLVIVVPYKNEEEREDAKAQLLSYANDLYVIARKYMLEKFQHEYSKIFAHGTLAEKSAFVTKMRDYVENQLGVETESKPSAKTNAGVELETITGQFKALFSRVEQRLDADKKAGQSAAPVEVEEKKGTSKDASKDTSKQTSDVGAGLRSPGDHSLMSGKKDAQHVETKKDDKKIAQRKGGGAYRGM